jgi:hypothetical protein
VYLSGISGEEYFFYRKGTQRYVEDTLKLFPGSPVDGRQCRVS